VCGRHGIREVPGSPRCTLQCPYPPAFPARDAGPARQEEAERVAAFHEAQEWMCEEREAAEARAARERDIERRREAGWG
jgi:hypothetical protein